MTDQEINPLKELVRQQAAEIARLRETLSRVFAVKERDGLKAEIAAMEANQKAYMNIHALWLTAKADRERKDALLLQCLRHNMPNSMKDKIKEELKCS